MPKKAKVEEAVDNVNDQLNKELSNLGYETIVELAENLEDMSVTCIPTDFPQLDVVLHNVLRGIPLGRDIEIYSRDPEVGKTSLGLEIAKSFQKKGMRTAIVDVEHTLTTEYLHQCGIVTDTTDKKTYAVRLIKPPEALSAEKILNLIKDISNTFDLIVVDSIAAMDLKANLEKTSDEATQVGGVSKLMSEFFRKNVSKRASILWINQSRTVIGGYNPTGNTRYVTSGGKALGFFASIRLELSIIDKIKGTGDDDIVGYKVKVYTSKNKVSPQWKAAILTYMFGEGFSTTYDWFTLGIKNKVIEKTGAWFVFGDVKLQGEAKFYARMKNDPALLQSIKDAITGTDSLEAGVSEEPAE